MMQNEQGAQSIERSKQEAEILERADSGCRSHIVLEITAES